MYNYFFRADEDGYDPYTDLAVERRRADLSVTGIDYEKELCPPGTWERVTVRSEEGAASIGRPIGVYDTLSLRRLDTLDEDGIFDAQEEVAKRLCTLCDDMKIIPDKILVAGLGNPRLTADSIGQKAATRVKPTMHIRDYDEELFWELEVSEISVLRPDVPANTGMDSSLLLRAVCAALSPDLMIVIDAITTRSRSRLGSTLQISDTGIFPGGMGKLKKAITPKEMGVPIISIGVPTVIDSRLFINQRTISELDFEPMFISPRDIDEITDNAGIIIGNAINQAFGLAY